MVSQLIETRGGQIPVGGVLRKIGNEYGILIGDAAGAVSPLTAGGLDPAMRLSRFAAEIVWERLKTDNPKILLEYSGELFRARFVSRLWMRRVIKTFTNQRLFELGLHFLRGKIGKKFASHVFFGRGSFPDVELKTMTNQKLFGRKIDCGQDEQDKYLSIFLIYLSQLKFMNERTKIGLEILQAAVLLGVLGDVLLRAMPWGLNVFLFIARSSRR